MMRQHALHRAGCGGWQQLAVDDNGRGSDRGTCCYRARYRNKSRSKISAFGSQIMCSCNSTISLCYRKRLLSCEAPAPAPPTALVATMPSLTWAQAREQQNCTHLGMVPVGAKLSPEERSDICTHACTLGRDHVYPTCTTMSGLSGCNDKTLKKMRISPILAKKICDLAQAIGYTGLEDLQERCARVGPTAMVPTPAVRPGGVSLEPAFAKLGLDPSASVSEVKSAWRKFVFLLHPDKAPPYIEEEERESRREQLSEINAAWTEINHRNAAPFDAQDQLYQVCCENQKLLATRIEIPRQFTDAQKTALLFATQGLGPEARFWGRNLEWTHRDGEQWLAKLTKRYANARFRDGRAGEWGAPLTGQEIERFLQTEHHATGGDVTIFFEYDPNAASTDPAIYSASPVYTTVCALLGLPVGTDVLKPWTAAFREAQRRAARKRKAAPLPQAMRSKWARGQEGRNAFVNHKRVVQHNTPMFQAVPNAVLTFQPNRSSIIANEDRGLEQ